MDSEETLKLKIKALEAEIAILKKIREIHVTPIEIDVEKLKQFIEAKIDVERIKQIVEAKLDKLGIREEPDPADWWKS